MLIGAFQPGKHSVQIEHVFVAGSDLAFAENEIARIAAAGRAPMVTVEPWDGLPSRWERQAWHKLAREHDGMYVRFAHEFNGTWYPWQRPPALHQGMWEAWANFMPRNVKNVWCPNVSYPGSLPLRDYWPDPDTVDVVALDGYARHGESMEQVFAESLRELRALSNGKPVMIAETGTERGRGQAKWWRDGLAWARREGIAAVVGFNEDKSHLSGDERNWSLSPASWKALLQEA